MTFDEWIEQVENFLYDDADYMEKAIAVLKIQKEALEWIMPKVHQGNHDGAFETCGKATCIEYHKAMADCIKVIMGDEK